MQMPVKHFVIMFFTLISGNLTTRYLPAAEQQLPNILWLTSEDNGPHLGCYGDDYATTPNLDGLAARGMIYLNCWSNAPVCAPARTTIISGLYPPGTGAQHMRSMTRLPKGFNMYPQYLRQAGYYCTNNSKEDYNLEKPGHVWDDSSRKAHWKNRKPGQPFFAIFNFTVSHESRIRTRPHTPVHDPAQVRIPAYHPDTPEVRLDWAQYHDKITEMDQQVGQKLKELEDAGLKDDTIIFYYGDHGSGMPRNKRWCYNSGLHVPLIVVIPENFKHLAPDDFRKKGKSDRLVGFIDLAPTVLSLAGVKPPEWYQGHAFLGKYNAPEQPYLYGFRGRMDERLDMVRSVRDKRYVYIRNYMPHKVYGQYLAYMFQTPTTRIWKKMFDEGKLNEAQSHFWQTKPAEELYDLETDPDEVNNLIGSQEHKRIRNALSLALKNWQMEIRDLGFLPEDEIHRRSINSSPYEMGHRTDGDNRYQLEKIMNQAELATASVSNANKKLSHHGNNHDNKRLAQHVATRLKKGSRDKNSTVRYWSALGYLMREQKGYEAGHDELLDALKDDSKSVRIIAAETLGRYGTDQDLDKVLPVLMDLADAQQHGSYISTYALNAILELGPKAQPLKKQIAALKLPNKSDPARAQSYPGRLVKKILEDLK